jgi:hypothetical protein
VDLFQILNWKSAAVKTLLEERDRAGHGPQRDGSAIEEEVEEEEEEEEKETSCGPRQLYQCYK